MKLIFTGLLLFSSFFYGQFSDNFDSYPLSKTPEDWGIFRGKNDAGDDFNNWKLEGLNKDGSNQCFFVRYENSGELNEDWLVSPKIDLTDYEGNFLIFSQRNSFVGNATKYEIKISTDSQSDRDKFQTIASYNDASFGKNFSLKKINISKYDKKQIYIAFVKKDDDGNNWFIDNVLVQGKPVSEKGKSLFFPNPTSGELYTEKSVKSLQVINMDSRLLKTYSNTSSIDISDLPAGIYLLKGTYENNETFEQKIVKEN
ncbi:putative secreted protein (Por secretion system target) [Chryseobacterium sp. 52]|uniref:T9SS-dependent choice-of-anchor J family protein n=1 Tax=Chryseobacterium sp. 52 TaxID=2035213 RepID=UPI000C1A5DBD|nr:choice-of-anchor J domain-containing protein [Chryseobacterium sp. 52]PIF47708.1 putative secreted protein (Por secretion system target) [Chryseobacterium sp. 52]